MARIRLTVTNRKGVFNPEGKVIFKGLKRLGHQVEGVEVGKVFVLSFQSHDKDEILGEVEKMCDEFLVNPVLQDYTVDFLDDEVEKDDET